MRTMERRYFGTDGMRGRVGDGNMTPEVVMKLGWATGRYLSQHLDGEVRPRVLIGKDTRLSGYLFESALEAGLAAAGVDVYLLGPMPTPAIAYLTRTFRAQAGVVISASHNPHHDNGVKLFGGNGRKLPDEDELGIEALMDEPMRCAAPADVGRAKRINDAAGRYIEFCKGTFRAKRQTLAGMRIVVDCANGATYHVAGAVLRELGAQVSEIGVRPDGFNINQGCGSTDLAMLRQAVREQGADVGIALDGDGDRCLMLDHTGQAIDGDQLLFVIAQCRQANNKLHGPVIGTQMSNLGVQLALEALGIEFLRAKVGDRYVMEMLAERGGILGGESSGHVVCLDRTTTGDGIVTALQVLAAMCRSGKSLAELVEPVALCPQEMINVRISVDANRIMRDERVVEATASLEQSLNGQGRVLLRPSGTEPLIRVMVEGTDAEAVNQGVRSLAKVVETVAQTS